MKVKVEAWINDSCQEYLMCLVAQGYYGESWEVKMQLLKAFDDSLNSIVTDIFNEELKK
jgi:hypothetical protein